MRVPTICIYGTLFLFLTVSCGMGALFFIMHNRSSIDFSLLEHYNPGRPCVLLDDGGNEWARFELDKRKPIAYHHMPEHLINAFIAAEDWEFFHHWGISYKGMIRSALVNLYRGRKAQGASTITQQLVKLLFFDSRKTYRRKIKEICCALLVEHHYTKEHILETYLNHVCFGCGIYGVEAAAQRFWGKSAQHVTAGEAATLAGIVRSPANYCPIVYPLSCQQRRDIVLRSMHHLGMIDDAVYAQEKNAAIMLNNYMANQRAPHLKETIGIFLEDLFGKDVVYTGGLVVQTTINRAMQEQAEKIVTQQCAHLCETLQPDSDGALIALAHRTGEIKVLVGGSDYHKSKFNRALQARRQMGSTFKPLVYACAIEQGMSFCDTEIDEPLDMIQGGQVWQPQNFNRVFNGQITLAYALSHSNNIVTIKTFLKVNPTVLLGKAKKCRLPGPFHTYPSLALGCIDASLKEVVGMFNVFANDGVYVQPHYVRWIKDRWGTKIWKAQPVRETVFTTHVVGQVKKVLSLSLQRVRKLFPNKWITSEAICKTGTTNDSRTCWFVGATPEITTAVYIGCDDNRSMGENVYPLRTAFPIWLDFMRTVECTQQRFVYDPSLRQVYIDEHTGVEVAPHKRGAVAILVP